MAAERLLPEYGAAKKDPQREGVCLNCSDGLLHPLDYASRARINQHRSIVDDRISIIANTVLRRNIIIGDARFRKHRACSYIAFVTVGGSVFFDDIMTEARTCIH